MALRAFVNSPPVIMTSCLLVSLQTETPAARGDPEGNIHLCWRPEQQGQLHYPESTGSHGLRERSSADERRWRSAHRPPHYKQTLYMNSQLRPHTARCKTDSFVLAKVD